MTGKFANKSGPFAPSIAACRENRRILSVCFDSGRNRRRQGAYSHQIVRRGREGEYPGHPLGSSVWGFPEIADGFHPAEDFLHPFAQALTDGVARVAGGAAVDGRVPALAVLGHMRRGIQDTQRLDKLLSIISFITAHRNAMPAGKVANHALCRVPLGGAGSRSEAGSDDQAVTVLHQHMPHEAELGFFAFALAEKPRLRVGGGGVGLVQAPFSMKIHFRVATAAALGRRGVLGAETLQGSPGLNEGAVHGEMVVRQQSGLGGLLLDAPEKGRGQVRTEKALPILGEDGMVPDLVVHGQANKPAKQEILIQLLHQESFAADGVKDLEQ